MKLKLMLFPVVFLMIAVPVFAQDMMSREDFRNAEWQMKSEYYRNLLERGGGSAILDQSDYDVKYWELDIDITNINGQIIYGKVIMTSESTVDGLATIDYDFHTSMSADSVFMGGSPVVFTRPSNTIHITLDHAYNDGEQFTTVVYYHGHPPGGGFGSFTWDTHGGG